MRTTSIQGGKPCHCLPLLSFFLLSGLLSHAQWTTPNAANNINNTNSANVGIGTTSPASKLHVVGTALAASSDDALSGFVQLWSDNAVIFKSGNVNGGLRFGSATNLGAGGWSEKMRITDAGHVGIGNTAPGTLLDIGNATKISGVPGSNAIMGLNVNTSNATANFMAGSMVYAEQTVPSATDICGSIAYTVSSNASGNVALAIPSNVVHVHTGAGTLGDARGVESIILENGTGNITNAMAFFGVFGASSTGTIQNAYGLYVPNFPTGVVHKYGVYITDAAASNYFGGSLGIGTASLGSNKLAVEGTIGARKVVVTLTNPFPDYVFDAGYRVPSLDSVSKYIQAHHHLSEIPSADSVAAAGLDLGGNQAALLKKIEELTLYIIGQEKSRQALDRRMETQDRALKVQQERVDRLEKLVAAKVGK